jgi:hypothetical protein
MKALIALLVLVLGSAVLGCAQAPSGSAGSQSPTSPNAQTAPGNSADAGANPTPSTDQNDNVLQSQIESALRNEPALSSSHIAVNVTAESISLSGTIGSGKDKQTAERIAQSFDGNRKMNDTLAITGHGHSDLAPDHSALNNSGTGNTQTPATSQGNNGNNNPPTKPPQR